MPGWLYPLPVPEHPWQHICVDFKLMPRDEDGYDTIAVFIDRFSKKAVSLPCKKTATARVLAEGVVVSVKATETFRKREGGV